MPNLKDLKVKLFADGADIEMIERMAENPLIKGFTTNPTLMRKAGVKDYRAFALDVLKVVTDRPVSFEVFSDDFEEMELQALEIASWGANVFVKIPVTNTKGESSNSLIKRLSAAGVQINVTALMTAEQVADVVDNLSDLTRNFVSVFAGRIADTGRDPLPIMSRVVDMLKDYPQTELIWASPRELLNVIQADAVGCHIITATDDVLKKLDLIGKDLDEFSLDTVHMFWQDAEKAGYTIEISQPASIAEGSSKSDMTVIYV
ncbi:MAG: transaldolase [Acidobacteria bacterium]|nr:MAG: transaldolase [Acidobacteriota bacterium]